MREARQSATCARSALMLRSAALPGTGAALRFTARAAQLLSTAQRAKQLQVHIGCIWAELAALGCIEVWAMQSRG